MRSITFAIFISLSSSIIAGDASLTEAVASNQRSPEHTLRDAYRHPLDTLVFFGIKPSMTVVEIWPGTGWYTEILAPYLKKEGTFYAAHFPEKTKVKFFSIYREKFKKKLAAQPALYEQTTLTEFSSNALSEIAPSNSADMALTFRNVHNWLSSGSEKLAFSSFYNALKPGGILGVVEHRAKPNTSTEDMKVSGYVTEEYVIQLAKSAGFRLLEKSDINANPKDSADHPKGVWTLPPTLRLEEKNKDTYLAIGESDRMTLKFIKPE
ncbi:MAG: class I SAM-dependent methyltransferase [Pseudomonadales bacterium]|nr:class I SAM-dependent methyltransferase [Pseudomonadales bacterium]